MLHPLVPFLRRLAKLSRWAMFLILAIVVTASAVLHLQGLSMDKALAAAAAGPIVAAGIISALAELTSSIMKS